MAVHIEVLDPYGDIIPGAEATIYIALAPAENEVQPLHPLCPYFTLLYYCSKVVCMYPPPHSMYPPPHMTQEPVSLLHSTLLQ